jgi:hypothetical protein
VNQKISTFGKKLQSVAKTIFIVYVEDLKTHISGAKWCMNKNENIINDFNFLLRVSCQLHFHARDIAK